MQEFLASFAVDIDEAGVSRLQKILRDNRDPAGQKEKEAIPLIRVRRENEYRAAEAVRQSIYIPE